MSYNLPPGISDDDIDKEMGDPTVRAEAFDEQEPAVEDDEEVIPDDIEEEDIHPLFSIWEENEEDSW
jgi:hypothetical protein